MSACIIFVFKLSVKGMSSEMMKPIKDYRKEMQNTLYLDCKLYILIYILNSPELKAQVSLSDQNVSIVSRRWRIIGVHFLHFLMKI